MSFLLANLLVLAAFVLAALLHRASPDLYYRSVQEDEALEWATFWAFALAAAAAARAARGHWRSAHRIPWFLAGVSAFCAFVALEEISWGQRLLGYRPPAYFLEHNFQQELNVHNVVATRFRKLALSCLIFGYGVFLPLLSRLPVLRRAFSKLAIVTSPLGLAPAYLLTFGAYVSYPWSHTGEWVELALGLGFLYAALAQGESLVPRALLASTLAVIVLGASTAAAWRLLAAARPESLAAARVELEALRQDLAARPEATRCGLHKRLNSYVEKYGEGGLRSGRFSALTAGGLPEARADAFLDPWNSPYWVRDSCSPDRRTRAAFVYSFGPNRRRDSSEWEILGDDVGVHLHREGPLSR